MVNVPQNTAPVLSTKVSGFVVNMLSIYLCVCVCVCVCANTHLYAHIRRESEREMENVDVDDRKETWYVKI